ncbi:hypothetical protein Vadar_018777 [Vaccinium darrowii]|uniref:Uncharacterized protein n=1 Tax=Vaccinium darrowii TaxID=229202 RepID=A0ACB7Z5K5_9ERIC|nr:hypothetical protein Vadar_018777 [Vaccinium darrowii]
MDIIESILNILVQYPPEEEFSSADLSWSKFGIAERHDNVAIIPYARFDAFIIGECSNVECPTRFHIERGRKRSKGSLKEYKSDKYLEYRLYWCSFGPENYGGGGVKRLYPRPSLALIIYNDRRHVNKSGFVCHGPLDGDAIGPGAQKIPYICNEIQQQTMSMSYLGIPEENVLEKHIVGLQRYGDSNANLNGLASQYVHKLGMIIKRSTELDLDDQASVRIPVAAASTFGVKRLKYPLYTLLVFDSRQHALPVAWVITRSIANPDVSKWIKALLDCVRAVDPGWKINGFLIDDAAVEIDPIRDTFSCPVLFSLWSVCRSWLRNIVKRYSNIEVQREIFKRLGNIVHSIWGGVDYSVASEELNQDFVDQTSFVQYFNASWVPKLEMWLTTMRNLPLASQEASGAIEAYHVKLKVKLYDDSHLGVLQRVDWLVHKLTTELHSSYWLDRYADENDSFQNVKEEYIVSTSWHRALQIPDCDVALDDKDHLFAKVVSQKDSSLTHLVWNPGSEFSFCNCSWSIQGNLCKHVIKVNMLCENRQDCQASMSCQSYKEILTNLWKKPIEDSICLDLSIAWTQQILEQIQKLVKLNSSNDIGCVVNNLPLKWVAKRGRPLVGKPPSGLALPSSLMRNGIARIFFIL